MQPAGFRCRRQGLQIRLQPCDVRLAAAGHQAIAIGQPPDTAGNADIGEIQPLAGQQLGATHGFLIEAIGAIDQQIIRLQQPGKFADGGFRRLARRQHQPDNARRRQVLQHFRRRFAGRDVGFLGCQFLRHVKTAVQRANLNTGARQTPRHIAAHATETIKTDFQHAALLVLMSGVSG